MMICKATVEQPKILNCWQQERHVQAPDKILLILQKSCESAVNFAAMYTLKKSLGQHFLKDENICRRIVTELTKCAFTNLLEVGPGGGALTKHLIQLPNIHFKAVELDEEKVVFLKKT